MPHAGRDPGERPGPRIGGRGAPGSRPVPLGPRPRRGLAGRNLFAPLLAALRIPPVSHLVGGDRIQPVDQTGVAAEPWQRRESADEHVLHEVVHCRAVPNHPQDFPRDPIAVAGEQLRLCEPLAPLGRLEDRGLVRRFDPGSRTGTPTRPTRSPAVNAVLLPSTVVRQSQEQKLPSLQRWPLAQSPSNPQPK